VLEALSAEGECLARVLTTLDESDFDLLTPCPPWSVRELLAHLLVATNRLPSMLASPEPERPDVTAAHYYRPDARFSPAADAARIDAARADAAGFANGAALACAVDEAWRVMAAAARTEPATRLVRTRWNDAMSLTDFLVTRVVELAVHGLDLAVALGHPPWTTDPAAELVQQLLLEGTPAGSVEALGWDRLTFVRKATARLSLTDAEAALVADRDVRWLTLGGAGRDRAMRLDVAQQLRVKGLASVEALAEATGGTVDGIAELLAGLEAEGLVEHRGGRVAGWTLTSAGREEGSRLLAEEQARPGLRAGIDACYRRFLALNEPFKAICTAWQVRDLDAMSPTGMTINDHSDADYDAAVIDRLGAVHDGAMATTADLTGLSDRFGRYGPRLSAAYLRVRDGDHRWLTTPLIGSYHDVWMELREDLLVTLGIERREGTT